MLLEEAIEVQQVWEQIKEAKQMLEEWFTGKTQEKTFLV